MADTRPPLSKSILLVRAGNGIAKQKNEKLFTLRD